MRDFDAVALHQLFSGKGGVKIIVSSLEQALNPLAKAAAQLVVRGPPALAGNMPGITMLTPGPHQTPDQPHSYRGPLRRQPLRNQTPAHLRNQNKTPALISAHIQIPSAIVIPSHSERPHAYFTKVERVFCDNTN